MTNHITIEDLRIDTNGYTINLGSDLHSLNTMHFGGGANSVAFAGNGLMEVRTSMNISGGTVQLRDAAVLQTYAANAFNSGTIALQPNSSLYVSVANGTTAGAAVTFDGAAGGSGGLLLAGVSTTIGSIQSLTAGAGHIRNDSSSAATLTVSNTDSTSNFSGLISDGLGQLALVKDGAGTFSLSGSNSYTGGTTVRNGILAIAHNVNLGIGTLTLNGGTLRPTTNISLNRALAIGSAGGTFDTAGHDSTMETFAGSGTFTKAGAGALIITSSSNTFDGALKISEGTFRIFTGNTLTLGTGGSGGTLSGNLLNDGRLVFNRSTDIAYADTISGGGVVERQGSGIITFSGTNTYSGGTTLTGGEIQANHAEALGSGNITFNGGTLGYGGGNTADYSPRFALANGGSAYRVDTGGENVTWSANLSGGASNSLVKSGSGTLTLTGANSYAGGTTVTAGTVAAGSLGTGSVTMRSGGAVLALGPLTVGNVRAESASGIFNTNGFNVTAGNLSTDGAVFTKEGSGRLTITGASAFTNGKILINDGDLGIAPGASLLIQNTTQGEIHGDERLTGNVHNDGTLTFETNFYLTYLAAMSGTGSLVFRSVGVSDADFLIGGHSGGASTFSGHATLESGILVLGRNNALGTGPLSIDSGGIRPVSDGVTLNNPITLNGDMSLIGGTILTGSVALTKDLAITIVRQAPRSVNPQILGNISGAHSLTINKSDDVNLTLGGNNTYTGRTTINDALILANGAHIFGNDSTVNLNNAGVFFNAPLALDYAFDIGTTSSSINTGSHDGSIKTILGTGVFTKSGSGQLSFTEHSLTFNGDLHINEGTFKVGSGQILQIGIGSTTGSLSGNVVNDGQLAFARTSASVHSYGGIISGTGTVAVGGILTMTGSNTYSGGTTIGTGDSLIIGGTAGAVGTGPIENKGMLTFARISGEVTVGGVISGTGNLHQNGAGSVWLGGGNSYTGDTYLEAGTIGVASDAALGSGRLYISGGGIRAEGAPHNVSNSIYVSGDFTLGRLTYLRNGIHLQSDATITLANPDAFSGQDESLMDSTISGDHSLTITKGANGSSLAITGTNTHTGGTTIKGGAIVSIDVSQSLGSGTARLQGSTLRALAALSLNHPVELGAGGGGTFDANGFHSSITSVSGTGGLLVKDSSAGASGSLTLPAANSYSGGTTVESGRLTVDHNGALGSGSVTVKGAGTLVVSSGAVVNNAIRLEGGTYSRELSGDLAHAVDSRSSLGGRDTSAALLDGFASTTITLTTSFSAGSSDTKSDIYHFAGIDPGIFVLELSFTSTDSDSLLGWLNANGDWVNAREGNAGNNPLFAAQFDGTYAQFVALHPATVLADRIGAWGVDTSVAGTISVWTVLNHNSEFAVIPEPSAAVLAALGLGVAIFRFRTRRSG